MDFNATCVYKKLPDGVYEISIREISRAGVQMFFQHLTTIYAEAVAANAVPVRTLVHAPSTGSLPIVSLAGELQKWFGEYGKTPARCAVIYDGSFGALADMLARNAGYRAVILRVFNSAHIEDAREWLLMDASVSAASDH